MAENIGIDSFLSKIAASVDDAQSSKAPIQDVADNFYYVNLFLLY